MKITRPYHPRGQSLVELALLLPALLLLVVVTLDLGRGIYYYSVIYNAAREGARYGIIHPDDIPGIRDAAINLAIGIDLQEDDIDVLFNPPEPNAKTIQVTIEYPFELVTPLAVLVTSCNCNIIDLQTSSTMIIER